jgi:exosortase
MSTKPEAVPSAAPQSSSPAGRPLLVWAGLALLAVVLVVLYRRAAYELYDAWTLVDGYYSHGPFVPLISLFFVWRLMPRLKAAPAGSSILGYPFIAAAGFFLLVGDYLGFRVFTEFSMLPMIVGLCLLFLGYERTKILWFPLVFLIFMIPIPASITQSLALNLKLVAAEVSVQLANLMTLPMVREGSFIYFKDDNLIIGEVCGGLRSLIALLAFGALMAYISKAKTWARILLLATAPLIAMISNIARIFLLCVIGYFYGSETAAGTVHDVSGVLIFVVAFILFFVLDSQLRKWFPAEKKDENVTEKRETRPLFGRRVPRHVVVVTAVLIAITVLHLRVNSAQAAAVDAQDSWTGLEIPDFIGRFERLGWDSRG